MASALFVSSDELVFWWLMNENPFSNGFDFNILNSVQILKYTFKMMEFRFTLHTLRLWHPMIMPRRRRKPSWYDRFVYRFHVFVHPDYRSFWPCVQLGEHIKVDKPEGKGDGKQGDKRNSPPSPPPQTKVFVSSLNCTLTRNPTLVFACSSYGLYPLRGIYTARVSVHELIRHAHT